MNSAGEMVRVTSRDGFEFGAYHVEPQGARKGGVIVVQEIFGLSSHVREMADRFGAAGYEALAPSMFDRARPGYLVQPADVAAHMAEGSQLAVGNGPVNAMNDIGACFDGMKGKGPVFITGYCYGGTMSWVAAAQLDGLSAASCYYGGNILQLAQMEPKCPIECHFGETDDHIPIDKVREFAASHPKVVVHYYAAGHGFARRGSSDYHPTADATAFERTLSLFEQAVK